MSTQIVMTAAEGYSYNIPRHAVWRNRLYSLMEEGADNSAALNVSFVHQSIEVRQQGVSGLEDFS